MKKHIILRAEMVAAIAVSLIIVALYELGLVESGLWTGDEEKEFLCVSAMELLTVCLIPLALRYFKGSLGVAAIGVPMVVNTLLYYLFMRVAFGYLAIIGLICALFVWSKVCVKQDEPANANAANTQVNAAEAQASAESNTNEEA